MKRLSSFESVPDQTLSDTIESGNPKGKEDVFDSAGTAASAWLF